MQRHSRTGSVQCRTRPGRSRIISPADDEAIKLLNKLYRSLTAPEVTAEMNKDEETHISIAFNTRKNNTRLCSCHN